MKELPLPEHLPGSVQILFWILTGLLTLTSGVSIWFLLRYVSNRDRKEESLTEKNEKMAEKLNTLNNDLVRTTSDIKLAGSEFKREIKEQISTLQKSGITLDNSLKEALRLAEELGENFREVSAKVDDLVKTVEAHSQNFSRTAKALKRLDGEVSEIKTVLKQAGPNVIIVGQRKPNEGG